MRVLSYSLTACKLMSTVLYTNGEGLTYTPKNDVTQHSKIALDTLDITTLIGSKNVTEALNIYQNGKNREGKSLQAMAQKNWVDAGLENLEDYEAYAALFFQRDGNPFLDNYNLDAMNCNNSFNGQSPDMCEISAKKNLLCTGLLYAQYEGVSALQYGNEKNWDELFAFWNGVYDETVDSRVNSGGPGAVQKKRDSDFGTSFREASIQAIIDGQKAFGNGLQGDAVDKVKLAQAYEDFKKANLATFAQATLKYSSLFDADGLDQVKMDQKWGEGYTYFRCGAGLMRTELAVYVNYLLDPRGKENLTFTPKETYCKIAKKMLSLEDIGMGVKMEDLNVEAFLTNIKEDCDITDFNHVEGTYTSETKRSWIPVLGFIIVIGFYIAGYRVVTNRISKRKQL